MQLLLICLDQLPLLYTVYSNLNSTEVFSFYSKIVYRILRLGLHHKKTGLNCTGTSCSQLCKLIVCTDKYSTVSYFTLSCGPYFVVATYCNPKPPPLPSIPIVSAKTNIKPAPLLICLF